MYKMLKTIICNFNGSVNIIYLFVDIQDVAEKRENLKLTMRFRPAVKFLLHTQYARGFVTLKRLDRL
jgi:hypothetical protein